VARVAFLWRPKREERSFVSCLAVRRLSLIDFDFYFFILIILIIVL
jgi:hypothetical protein